jgi:hypothetical protein
MALMGCFILNVFSGKDSTAYEKHIGKEDQHQPDVRRNKRNFVDLTKTVESLDFRMRVLEDDKKQKDEKRRRRDPDIKITPTEENEVLDQVLRVFIIVICELVLMHSHHQLLKQHRKFFPTEYKRKSAAPCSLDQKPEIIDADKALNVIFVTKRDKGVRTIRFHHSMACTHTLPPSHVLSLSLTLSLSHSL